MSTVQETAKVKLPSIAELTSRSIQPNHSDTSPLLHQHMNSSLSSLSSTSSRESSIHPQPTISGPSGYSSDHIQRTPVQLQPAHVPSYQYYSHPISVSPLTFPQSYYRPMFYPPPNEPPTASRYVPIAPEQVAVYNAPEVINRPMNECHRCGTTETPEWRRGPNGLRTLCNACGLFHAKLVKRKGAALAAEEVLNNKVFKGKNGRRVCVKGHTADVKKYVSGPQVTDFPPIAHNEHLPSREDFMHRVPRQVTRPASSLPMVPNIKFSGGSLPPPALVNPSQSVSVLQN